MWKDIPETNYQATEAGLIRHRKHKRILKHFKGVHGYPAVQFGKLTCLVHRLVLTAFRGKPEPRQESRHLDGSRDNCHLSNLEWATHKQNSADRKKHGTEIYGEQNGRSRLTEDQVREIRQTYVFRKHGFGCSALAKKYDVCPRTIEVIIKRKTWTHI